MNENQETTGAAGMPLRLPLTVMEYVDTADIMDADSWFITRCANTKGCDIFTPEEVKAHARQLVHACNNYPKLVEALRRITNAAEGYLMGQHPGSNGMSVVEQAREALASAQGGVEK